MVRFSAIVISFLLITLLSACGGGGGGDDGGGTNPTPPPANVAPSTNAGTDITADEETTVSLTGSATDTDGTIASYAWSQTSGQAVTISGADTATASFSAPVTTTQLTLILQLVVTDNDGASDSDEVVITINPVNTIPIASAGNDQTVDEQSNVSLSASATDTDGTIASYSWIQTAGIAVTINNGSIAESSFTAPITTTQIELTFQVTVTDNEGATANDSIVITVNPIVIVTVGQTTVDIATVSSGAFGEVAVVDGIVSIDITTVTDEGLVTAYDADGNIIWLGYIKIGDETIELNGRSTALELMLLVPNITIFNSSQPDVLISYFNDSQDIDALITYLSENNDWYQLPQEFSDLYSAAVLSIFNQINPITTIPTTKTSGNPGPQNAVIIINENDEDVITTNYNQTLNGIEVKVENITTAGKEDLFSIEVTNKFNRWVGIAIGPDPETYSGSPAALPSGNLSYIHKGKDDTARFEDELNKLDDDPDTTSYGIYVYGPALNDFWGNYAEGRFANDLHGNATAYTLLFDIAVPVFGRAIGGKSCLQQMFDPTRQTYGIAADIISNPNIQDYLSKQEVDKAALEIGILIANSIVDTGSDCLKDIALKQLQKLIPLIGQIQTITDLFANISTVDDVYDTIAKSNSKTLWEVSNRINMSFYMEGVGYLTQTLWGSLAYRDFIQIPSDYIADYPGTCVHDDTNHSICEGYTFAKGTPKIIAYTLKCIDPVTEAVTPCMSGVVEPDMIDLTPETDGTLSFTIDYSSTGDKEYSHIFKVYDEAGAENQYTASVQIQTAAPQLVYRIDGQEFDSVLDETGDLRNVTPYEINTQGAGSKTVTVEVHNKGLGVAEINQIGPILGSTHFTASNYSTDFTNSPIALGESRTFDLTYTPLGFATEAATISLFGVGNLLGDENLLTSSIGYKQYTRMDLIVEGNLNGPDINVVMDGVDVPSSSTSVAYDFGDAIAYKILPFSMIISNEGTTPLTVSYVLASGLTNVDFTGPVVIEPNASINITGSYEMFNILGLQERTITIISDDPVDSLYDLLLSANVIPPAPPIFTMSPLNCNDQNYEGNNSATFDFRIESEANGSYSIITGAEQDVDSSWGRGSADSYSGITVVCSAHWFRTNGGGTLAITLIDEFDQTVEINQSFPNCPITGNTLFVWTVCSEYHGNP